MINDLYMLILSYSLVLPLWIYVILLKKVDLK